MSSLRSKTIRLAYQRPDLRPYLLPLVKEAKSEFEQQFEDAKRLDGVDPALAKAIVDSGLEDGGSPADDKIPVSKASWSAAALKPSQTSIVLEKAVGMAIKQLIKNKIGGDIEAIVSSDNYIMDGHHRWAASILAGGKSAKVSGLKADLKGSDLVRVLNILTKGVFGVAGGKPGKGAISDLTPANVKSVLEDALKSGIKGEYPISAKEISDTLERHFGSAEKGIEEMSANAKMITTTIPGWAPDRKQMPVIEPEQVPEAAKIMNQGLVDWSKPYKQASLREATLRLARQRPDLRPYLLPLL